MRLINLLFKILLICQLDLFWSAPDNLLNVPLHHYAQNVALSKALSVSGLYMGDQQVDREHLLQQLAYLQKAAELSGTSVRKSLVTALRGHAHRSLERPDLEFTRGLMSILSRYHPVYRLCPTDPTLPVEHLRQVKLYIAMDMHNSEAIIPTLIVQLVALASYLENPAQMFVSIYESDSKDQTAWWLRLASMVLTGLDIPHNFTIDGMKHQVGQPRIDFLYKIRNAAMAPLYAGQYKMKPDHVIFINDVYFCASDIARLLLHRADFSCGLDFNGERGWFYDQWVSRDVQGHRFTFGFPYVRHRESALRLMRGLPIPVIACWNGLAVLNAKPFLEHKLRFRDHLPGECAHRECSLLADDFTRLGFKNILLDPAVRVSYNLNHAWYMHANESNVPWVTWQEASKNPHDPALFVRNYTHVECYDVPVPEHPTWIRFDMMRHINIFSPNFTDVFFQAQANRTRGQKHRAL